MAVFRNFCYALLLLIVASTFDDFYAVFYPVTVEEVYGSYVSEIETGTETLEVRMDGTYSHRYVLDGIN